MTERSIVPGPSRRTVKQMPRCGALHPQLAEYRSGYPHQPTLRLACTDLYGAQHHPTRHSAISAIDARLVVWRISAVTDYAHGAPNYPRSRRRDDVGPGLLVIPKELSAPVSDSSTDLRSMIDAMARARAEDSGEDSDEDYEDPLQWWKWIGWGV